MKVNGVCAKGGRGGGGASFFVGGEGSKQFIEWEEGHTAFPPK